MPAAANPYAPPKANVDDVARANSEAEEVREEHIKHEASIRSIGILYYLSGGLLFIAGVALLAGSSVTALGKIGPVISVAYAAFGALFIIVGRGVRKFQPWARITAIALAFLGLLGSRSGPCSTATSCICCWPRRASGSSKTTTKTSSRPRRTSNTAPLSSCGFSSDFSCWQSRASSPQWPCASATRGQVLCPAVRRRYCPRCRMACCGLPAAS
jgi:hypothetical protein